MLAYACAAYQDRVLRNLPCKRVQVDDIWSFVYAKAANVRHAKAAPLDSGDVWTWTAICADTKLLASFYVGDRTYASARPFMEDLKDRLASRIQLTSDGHRAYVVAVREAFEGDVSASKNLRNALCNFGGLAPNAALGGVVFDKIYLLISSDGQSKKL